MHSFNSVLWGRREQAACILTTALLAYAALPCAIHHRLHVSASIVSWCLWWFPCRLPWYPPAPDNGTVEVPPGERGGAECLLPASKWHPGGALQERCGEDCGFIAISTFIFPLGKQQFTETIQDSNHKQEFWLWLCYCWSLCCSYFITLYALNRTSFTALVIY